MSRDEENAPQQPPAESSTQLQWSPLDYLLHPLQPSPLKRHPVVTVDAARTEKETCQLCGEEEETTFWLGCGHKPKKGRAHCTYWVHQGCIGFFFYFKRQAGKGALLFPSAQTIILLLIGVWV